jgi:hypothetical protein
METAAISKEEKRQKREADNSPPCSAEVKNEEVIPALPHMSSWRSDYLSQHRCNVTFFILEL